MSQTIIADQISIKLATAIEGARARRNEASARLVRSDVSAAPADAADVQYLRAATTLERYLYAQAPEVSEETLCDLFDRVGRA